MTTLEEFRREFIVNSLNKEYKEIQEILESCTEEDFRLPEFGSSLSWHISFICDLLDGIVTNDMKSIRKNRSYSYIPRSGRGDFNYKRWRVYYSQHKQKTIDEFTKKYGEAAISYQAFGAEIFSDDYRVLPWGPFTESLSAFEYLKKLLFRISEQKGYIKHTIEVQKEWLRYKRRTREYRHSAIPNYGRVIYLYNLIAYLNLEGWARRYNHPALRNSMSEGEIDDLEESCGIRFPPSFREFLAITGQNWGNIIFSQAGGERAEYLRELQDIPGEFISEEIPAEKYPRDIFIISSEYGGQQIIYFKRDDMNLEDPPVYHATMADYELEVSGLDHIEHRLSEHFSDYINDITHYKIREELLDEEPQ